MRATRASMHVRRVEECAIESVGENGGFGRLFGLHTTETISQRSGRRDRYRMPSGREHPRPPAAGTVQPRTPANPNEHPNPPTPLPLSPAAANQAYSRTA